MLVYLLYVSNWIKKQPGNILSTFVIAFQFCSGA
jgi:hypothetical protein